jgi:LPXTG-motif cell wall-anchored protein
MRGSTALLLAGAVAIVVGTTAPVLAAEDQARVTPAPEAAEAPPEETTVQSADTEEAAPEETDAALETPPVEATESADREPEPDSADRRRKPKQSEPDPPKQPLANASVTMKDIKFKPKTLTISPGDRVTWTNRDTAQHNAVDEGEFETKLLDKGESASVTIDEAGTYNYVCTVHAGMNGKLVAETEGGGSGGGSNSSSGSSGGTSSPTGSSGTSSSPSTGSGSSSSGSSGSLPNTGQEHVPLLILGAGLIAAGLLARAFHEYWIWR